MNRIEFLRKSINSLSNRGLLRTIILGFTEILAYHVLPNSILSSEIFVKLRFTTLNGYFFDIDNPSTFNEKIQHRKFHTHDSRYAEISDKYAVRSLVSEKIGDHILTNLHYVTDDPESIPFGSLPDRYVVKPNHMSGEIRFVDSNDDVDADEIKRQCDEWLASTYGQSMGEYWYADIPPRILFEEDLRDDDYSPPDDYKFYVFDGHVRYIHVDTNRFTNHRRRFYDREWKPQRFTLAHELAPVTPRPSRFNEMLEIAEKLGAGFDFIRVDLYEAADDSVLFGEMTVAPGGGTEQFTPTRMDAEFGEHWN